MWAIFSSSPAHPGANAFSCCSSHGANVANLLLARAAGREKEVAIRLAVGAGRARLLRELPPEKGILALTGGALGLVLGYCGLKLLLAFSPSEVPRLSDTAVHSGLDGRAPGFTLPTTPPLVCFSVRPGSRPPPAPRSELQFAGKLKPLWHERASHRASALLLVISEMALGLVLLIGSGLLISSAISMRAVLQGFQTRATCSRSRPH